MTFSDPPRLAEIVRTEIRSLAHSDGNPPPQVRQSKSDFSVSAIGSTQ